MWKFLDEASDLYHELLHFPPSSWRFFFTIETFRHGSVFLFCAAVYLIIIMRRI